jgi:DNA transposition AAA+ family ATPase
MNRRFFITLHYALTTKRKIMIRKIQRLFIYTLLTAFTFVGFTQTVQAAMIGTEQIAAAGAAEQNRAKIAAALDRPDVMAQLEKMGVDKNEAKDRVAALTDAEAASMANQIDSMPAGGDVLGVLLFIFVLLLVTDILGLTKVFPFTRSKR